MISGEDNTINQAHVVRRNHSRIRRFIQCAYRLPVYNIPSQQHLKIVAGSPERYVVRVTAADSTDFPVKTVAFGRLRQK